MKILVVCQYYQPEPFRISDICEALAARGHAVTVLTGLPNYPEGAVPQEYRHHQRRRETIGGVEVIRSFEIGRGHGKARLFLNYMSYALSARRKAKKLPGDFDVVFVNQLSPVMMAWPAIAYQKKYHKKLLLYCMDLWPASLSAGGVEKGSAIYRVFHRISRNIYRKCDKIAGTSRLFQNYFTDTFPEDHFEIAYLPQYAEDLFSAEVDTAKPGGVEATEQEGTDEVNLVFAGNIGDMQSVETIIEAARLLKDRPDIRFHIVGDGSQLEVCKSLAADLDSVVFYGRRPVEDMPGFYKMADAMLVTLKDHPSISYTLPGKVQSYMAAGKPILGAINGETKQVLEDAGCGTCCPAEDASKLADLIADFAASNNKEQMGRSAAAYYRAHFSKEAFLARLEQMLEELAC